MFLILETTSAPSGGLAKTWITGSTPKASLSVALGRVQGFIGPTNLQVKPRTTLGGSLNGAVPFNRSTSLGAWGCDVWLISWLAGHATAQLEYSTRTILRFPYKEKGFVLKT